MKKPYNASLLLLLIFTINLRGAWAQAPAKPNNPTPTANNPTPTANNSTPTANYSTPTANNPTPTEGDFKAKNFEFATKETLPEKNYWSCRRRRNSL